jgi:hypothetical protein
MAMGDSYTSFNSQTDEYLGISFIDSPEKLAQLQVLDQRVWVFADLEATKFMDEDINNLLAERYVKHNEGAAMTVYVNR